MGKQITQPNNEAQPVKRLVSDIDPELHRRLRMVAAQKDCTMREIIVDCLERCLPQLR